MIKPKLKKGTRFLYENREVIVEHDRQDGKVCVLGIKEGTGANEYVVVDIDSLQPLKCLKSKIKAQKRPLSQEQINKKEDLRSFYNKLDVPFNCQECGKPLYAFREFAKRCVSAHILPKSKFPSVAMNPDNIIFLGSDIVAGVCDCHTFYDYSVENRVNMKIYPIVVDRFESKLKDLLTKHELIEALKYLWIKIDLS